MPSAFVDTNVLIYAADESASDERKTRIARELLRQRETATELLPLIDSASAQIAVHPGLNEYDGAPLIDIYLRDHYSQDFAGLTQDALSLPILDRKLFQQVFEATTAKWINDELVPGADDQKFEAWPAFQRRVHGIIDELMARHSDGERFHAASDSASAIRARST